MNYAKLSNRQPKFCTYIPNVSNASPADIEAYAISLGYKPVEYTTAPHQYTHSTWVDKGDKLIQVWKEDDIVSVKQQLLEQVQMELNATLEQRSIIPCPLGFDIVFDTQAQMNVMGMVAFGQGGKLIDANDTEHELSKEDMLVVAVTLSQYKTTLYDAAQKKREVITKATTFEELIGF